MRRRYSRDSRHEPGYHCYRLPSASVPGYKLMSVSFPSMSLAPSKAWFTASLASCHGSISSHMILPARPPHMINRSWAMPINYGHIYTAVPNSPACLSTSQLPLPRRSHRGQLLPKRPRGNTPRRERPRLFLPIRASCSRIILVKIRHAAKLNTNNNQKCPVAPPSKPWGKIKAHAKQYTLSRPLLRSWRRQRQ